MANFGVSNDKTGDSFGIDKPRIAYSMGNAGGGGDPDPDCGCDPEHMGPYLPTFGVGFGNPDPFEWPEWVENCGCGFLSLAKLNESAPWGPHTIPRKLVAPWVIDGFLKCLQGRGGHSGGPGKGLFPSDLNLLLECKKEWMFEKYRVKVDPETFNTSADCDKNNGSTTGNDCSAIGCPPLCKEEHVMIGYNITTVKFNWPSWSEEPVIIPSTKEKPNPDVTRHCIECTVVDCDINGVCLTCYDQGAQAPEEGPEAIKTNICANAEGVITSYQHELSEEMKEEGWKFSQGNTPKEQPGECKKQMLANPGKYKGTTETCKEIVQLGPNTTGSPHNITLPITQIVPTIAYVVKEVPCPEEEKEEGKQF